MSAGPFPDPPVPALSVLRYGLLHEGVAGLPPQLTSLVGRAGEVQAVVQLLRDPGVRLLTVTGPGGVGKTRLAVAAAGEAADDFPDGVIFVNLAPVADPGFVVPAIAQALGLSDMGGEPLVERLKLLLRDRRALLLLDTFEHVLAAGPRVREIVVACPQTKVLVTSRGRLRLSGEQEFPLSPLALPEPLAADAPVDARQNAAVQLFVERAQSVNPAFALSPEMQPLVREIVRRVDGLPLGIELAAARIKLLPPAAMLQRLEPRLPLLSGGARDLPQRQQTLYATIAWSYDLLSSEEQAFFQRSSVFVGGFTLEGAAAISMPAHEAASPGRPGDVLEHVASLIEHSLVVQQVGPTETPRFRMLDTVREFAYDRLAASGDTEVQAARAAHAAYILGLAERLRERYYGTEYPEVVALLTAELADVRAALAWAITAADAETGVRLAIATSAFWATRGYYPEGQQWLERAVAHAAPLPAHLRAEAAMLAGFLATYSGDVTSAERLLSEGFTLARMIPAPVTIAMAQLGLGMVALQRGEAEDAAEFTVQALASFQELASQDRESLHLNSLAITYRGLIARITGDFPLAAAMLAEAQQRQRHLNYWWGLCETLCALGDLMLDRGDPDRAMSHFRESLNLALAHDQQRRLAEALDGLARVAVVRGEPVHAAELFGAAHGVRQQAGAAVKGWDRAANETALAAARAALPADAFDAAFAAGQSSPHSIANAEALAIAEADPSPPPVSAPADLATTAGLTQREAQVLGLLTEGLSDREIAARLSISERTAGNHVLHILQKLNVDSRTAAAVLAVRHGLA